MLMETKWGRFVDLLEKQQLTWRKTLVVDEILTDCSDTKAERPNPSQ
jgi:hypothetical protein